MRIHQVGFLVFLGFAVLLLPAARGAPSYRFEGTRLCSPQTSPDPEQNAYSAPRFGYMSDADIESSGNTYCFEYAIEALENFGRVLRFGWFAGTVPYPLVDGDLKDPRTTPPLRRQWPLKGNWQRTSGKIFYYAGGAPASVANLLWSGISSNRRAGIEPGGAVVAAGQFRPESFPPIESTAYLNFFERDKWYRVRVNARSSVKRAGTEFVYSYTLENRSDFSMIMLWTAAASSSFLDGVRNYQPDTWLSASSHTTPFFVNSGQRITVEFRANAAPQVVDGMVLIYGTASGFEPAPVANIDLYRKSRSGIYLPAYNPGPVIKAFPAGR